MRKFLFLLSILAITLPLQAQVIGKNRSNHSRHMPVLVVHSQLVVETVTVRDKAGDPVLGLTAKDFTLTENGKPQKIRFCHHQILSTAATPLPSLSQSQEKIQIYGTLSRSSIKPETSEKSPYNNKRLLAFYFDMSAMNPSESWRSLQAAEKFVRKQMTPDDLVAILRYNGASVDVLQDFTANRNRLLSIMTTLMVGEHQPWATKASDAPQSDNGAAFGQDNSEFNIFKTDRQLAALRTAIDMLGHLNEKKLLLYFAGGMILNGIDNQAQLHSTVDAAVRAGVAFWPIDARGLVAMAPLGDATQGSPGNIGMYSGESEQAAQTSFEQSQDTLYALAKDTGGNAWLDSNDLNRGILRAQQSISNYYILGYYTTNTARDGHYRRIKITVDIPSAAKVSYRHGYYAEKKFSKFNAADKERQLEDALMLKDPITDLAIAMELNYFQINRAEYFVPVIVRIPGHELALARHRGAKHAVLDFIGEIKDAYGNYTVTNIRDHVNVKLTGKLAADLPRMPLEYDTGFTLLPGKYKIKLLARDDATGRIGTYETEFRIPDLNQVNHRIPISSVVLGTQLVPLQNAVYNAMKQKRQAKEAAANPLVSNGEKLIPGTTRTFYRTQRLYVYLQGYEPGKTAATPVIGYVAFYRNHAMQFKSQAILVTPKKSGTISIASLRFSIPLKELKAGGYICQVTLLNPATGKSAFWRTKLRVQK